MLLFPVSLEAETLALTELRSWSFQDVVMNPGLLSPQSGMFSLS